MVLVEIEGINEVRFCVLIMVFAERRLLRVAGLIIVEACFWVDHLLN